MTTTVRLDSKNKVSTDQINLSGGAFIRACDSFFVLRPTLMFPLWTMTLIGYAKSSHSQALTPLNWFYIITGISALFGLVYLFNQFRDKDGDAQNGKLFLIPANIFSRKHLIVEIVLLSLTVIAGLWLSGFIHLWLMIIVIFLVAGIIYNYTPIALEQHPIGGIIAGVVGGWLLLRLGSMLSNGDAQVLTELPYVIAFGSACILTGLLDATGDRISGKRTFVVVYGNSAAIAAATIGVTISLLLGIHNSDWVISLPALVSLPFMAWSWFSNNVSLAVQSNKIAILGLSVAISVQFPLYLLIIFLYYMFARLYHRRRFGMDYPNLRGA